MIKLPNFMHPDGSESEKKQLPLVPLRDMVLFPFIITPVFVGRDKSIKALSKAMEADKRIFLTTQKNPDVLKPNIKDIFQVGTQATITQLLKLPDGSVKALVEGGKRGKIVKLLDEDGFLNVEYIEVFEEPLPEKAREAAIRTLTEAFEHYAKLSGAVAQTFFKTLDAIAAHESRYADTIAAQMPFKMGDKQKLLECGKLESRFFFIVKADSKGNRSLYHVPKNKGKGKGSNGKFAEKALFE